MSSEDEKLVEVRANEVWVGDRLVDPDTKGAGPRVADLYGTDEKVEVWTEDDYGGLPTLTLDPAEKVEVWR